jgi:hypothetical protein
MIGTDEKRNRPVEIAYPNLGGTCVEIERAFFVDLGGGIGRRKNLDANVRGTLEDGELVDVLGSLRATQATSTALTPPAVERGHSDTI